MIASVTDQNIEAFLSNDLSTLILARSTCNRCLAYIADVQRLLDSGVLGSAAIGVLMLDQPGAGQFKHNNPWLAHAQMLPYTVLYRNGNRIDGFSASHGHILLDHDRLTATCEPELVSMV